MPAVGPLCHTCEVSPALVILFRDSFSRETLLGPPKLYTSKLYGKDSEHNKSLFFIMSESSERLFFFLFFSPHGAVMNRNVDTIVPKKERDQRTQRVLLINLSQLYC